MKRTLIAALVVALVAVACGDDDASEPTTASTAAPTSTTAEQPGTTAEQPGTTEGMDEVNISIASFAFGPDTITVSVGTTVTWTNDEDAVDHTATSDDAVWDSATLSPGESFSFTFEEAGTFTYFCKFHPSMTATIVVEG